MANSVNGWPLDPSTQTISAGGKSTTVRAGDVATVLQYIAQQWHRRIEAIVTLHGYRSSKTNAAIGGDPGSNHISGTAIDVNGFRHPYEQGKGYKDQGFSAAQVTEMRRILSPVNDVVQWGYDYPKNWRDGMHMQIRKGASSAAVAAAARRVASLTSNPGGGTGNGGITIPGTPNPTPIQPKKGLFMYLTAQQEQAIYDALIGPNGEPHMQALMPFGQNLPTSVAAARGALQTLLERTEDVNRGTPVAIRQEIADTKTAVLDIQLALTNALPQLLNAEGADPEKLADAVVAAIPKDLAEQVIKGLGEKLSA